MGHLSNELWIPLISMVCTKTSQKEAFTYKAHVSQMNPHFTSNHNPGSFSFLILSPTCLFPSSSPNKNKLSETDSLLISHLTNKLIIFSYFSCLFWERLNIYKAQQLLIFTPSKTNKQTNKSGKLWHQLAAYIPAASETDNSCPPEAWKFWEFLVSQKTELAFSTLNTSVVTAWN